MMAAQHASIRKLADNPLRTGEDVVRFANDMELHFQVLAQEIDAAAIQLEVNLRGGNAALDPSEVKQIARGTRQSLNKLRDLAATGSKGSRGWLNKFRRDWAEAFKPPKNARGVDFTRRQP